MRVKVLLTIIVTIIINYTVIAQDNRDVQIQELYVKSGLEKQIAQFPMLIQHGFDQAVATETHLNVIPQSTIGEMRSSINTAFAPDNIKNYILTEFREKLSIDDLKYVLEWLNSPLGLKFTQLEESLTPDKYTEMQQYAQDLQKSPASPERMELIQQLDSAVKATDNGIELAMNAQLAVAIAIVSSLPTEQQPTEDKLKENIEQSRSQIEKVVRSQTLVTFLFLYKEMADDELKQYVSFATSQAGANYHMTTATAMKKANLKACYKWGEIIADILKNNRNKTDV